jgi:hypothetical protein
MLVKHKEEYDKLYTEYSFIVKQLKEHPYTGAKHAQLDPNFTEHYAFCVDYSNKLEETDKIKNLLENLVHN